MQVIWSCRFSFDPTTKLGLDVASCLITRYILRLQQFNFLARRMTLDKIWMKACLSCIFPFSSYICAVDIYYLDLSQCSCNIVVTQSNMFFYITQIRSMFSAVSSCSLNLLVQSRKYKVERARLVDCLAETICTHFSSLLLSFLPLLLVKCHYLLILNSW